MITLLHIYLHLWLDSVLETIGKALRDFQIVDSTTSDVMHLMVARILVEMDVSKGLPEKIFLGSPRGVWTQVLDYEGLPFPCMKCHMTGHVAARCSSNKARSMRKPTWWTGASDEHYTITKSSSILGHDDEESLASDGSGDTSPDVLDKPILEEVLSS